MQAISTHPDYDAAVPQWARARDVLAGEDAVKAAGEKYLPRLDSQSDAEYATYKLRAAFFSATARTLEEYLDLVFRRAPVLSLSDSLQVRALAADCDLWGLSFLGYARRALAEVLGVGRGGTLLAWNREADRPYLSFWSAEEIIDWEVAGNTLARVALRRGDDLLMLKLDAGACVAELHERRVDGWELAKQSEVMRGDKPLPFIPFVFHGAQSARPDVGKLPLADIISANLDHYRLDADYKNGLHLAALPTAWVSGFDKGTQLRIGSSQAWASEVADAKAGFLEFSGVGLAHLEKAIEKVEQRMALFGARLVESSGEQVGGNAELCGLAAVVASLNESLTRVLQLAHQWIAGADAAGISFAMNTDLGARAMTGDEITAVVAAWRAGAISRDSMLERLKRGEVLPDGRSISQERALIHGKAGGVA